MRIAMAALALTLAATAAPALDDPDALVKALYKLEQIPLKSREIDRYFSRDLAAAIKKDINKDEPGQTNDGDYRYNAQEFEITDLAFTKTTNQVGGTVTATFKNFGKANSVAYAMCLRRDGWRISDVLSDGWSMRRALELPATPVRC